MPNSFLIKTTTRTDLPGNLQLGWFAVSHLWIPEKKCRRLVTGKWYRIESNDCTIYRVIRFSPQLASKAKESTGQISIDYYGWNQLSSYAEDLSAPLPLSFRRARLYELIGCIHSHPDPGYRLAGLLGAISVILGVIGLILGIIPFFYR